MPHNSNPRLPQSASECAVSADVDVDVDVDPVIQAATPLATAIRPWATWAKRMVVRESCLLDMREGLERGSRRKFC